MKLFVFSILGIFVSTQVAYAQNGSSQPRREHRAEKRAFRLGVCVGQNLAAAGIDMSAIDKGAADDTTKAAFKAAMTACRPSRSNGASSSESSTDSSGTSASSGSATGTTSTSTSTSTSSSSSSDSSASDGTSATN